MHIWMLNERIKVTASGLVLEDRISWLSPVQFPQLTQVWIPLLVCNLNTWEEVPVGSHNGCFLSQRLLSTQTSDIPINGKAEDKKGLEMFNRNEREGPSWYNISKLSTAIKDQGSLLLLLLHKELLGITSSHRFFMWELPLAHLDYLAAQLGCLLGHFNVWATKHA